MPIASEANRRELHRRTMTRGTKVRLLVPVFCVLLLAGCSSEDSPTSPSRSPNPSLRPAAQPPASEQSGTADVAGTWTATLSASTDDIVGGGCLGVMARALGISRSWTATIEIDQTGNTLAETPVEVEGTTCRLAGSVTGATVNATVDSCAPDRVSIGVVPGCGSDPWHLESLSLTVAATVSGSAMTGTPTARGTAVSGSDSYAVSATGELSMSR